MFSLIPRGFLADNNLIRHWKLLSFGLFKNIIESALVSKISDKQYKGQFIVQLKSLRSYVSLQKHKVRGQ